jgi:hypothetical protein
MINRLDGFYRLIYSDSLAVKKMSRTKTSKLERGKVESDELNNNHV